MDTVISLSEVEDVIKVIVELRLNDCITVSEIATNGRGNWFKVNDHNFISITRIDDIKDKKFTTRANITGERKYIYKIVKHLMKISNSISVNIVEEESTKKSLSFFG